MAVSWSFDFIASSPAHALTALAAEPGVPQTVVDFITASLSYYAADQAVRVFSDGNEPTTPGDPSAIPPIPKDPGDAYQTTRTEAVTIL